MGSRAVLLGETMPQRVVKSQVCQSPPSTVGQMVCRVYNFLFCGILIQIEVVGDVRFEGYHSNLNDIWTDIKLANQITDEGG